MKNRKIIWLLLAMVLSLCSCYKVKITSENTSERTAFIEHGTKSTSSKTDINSANIIYKSDKTYKIFTNEEMTEFEYFIYDNDGGIIDMGYHDSRGSFDIYEENGLLVLDYGVGGNTWHERYYDTAKGAVSRFFEKPVQNTDRLIAYFEVRDNPDIVLVVRDIFDTAQFYKEINRDFSSFVITDQAKCEFIDNNTRLKLTYWTNPNDEEITEIIDVR